MWTLRTIGESLNNRRTVIKINRNDFLALELYTNGRFNWIFGFRTTCIHKREIFVGSDFNFLFDQ
jgi:hypothetical protein